MTTDKYEKIFNLFEKVAISQEKTDKQIEKMMKSQEKSEKRIEKMQKEMRESQEKTDRRIEKMQKEMRESDEKTNRTLIWIGVTQWDISEQIIESNFKPAMKKIWKDIKKVRKNIRRWKLEFDLLWVNSTEIFVWETKTRLTINHIDKFLEKQLPNFKECFPEYDKYKMYWVVWWRVISKKSLDYAMSRWLFVIKETHNWNAEVVHKNDFKPKEFVY
jgi:hypothetical protein